MQYSYDVVVIGAGSGGLTAAVGAAKIGKSVLLIERERMGGECTNTGCLPSKALLHHAKQYHQAATVAGKTTDSESFRRDAFAYVRQIRDSILKEETAETFKALGIEVVMGEAKFIEKDSVAVGETTYQFRQAIIATGSAPRRLAVPGLDESAMLTNQNLFELESIPERLLVIGSGPIGLEMGQALALLGSSVTIATIDNEFAKQEDEAIRPIIRTRFEKLEVRIELNAHFVAVDDGEAIYNRDRTGESEREPFAVSLDTILLAIGRMPIMPPGLEAAAVAYTERGITTDTQYRTSNPRVYAIGDVTDQMKFTHVADDAARQVVTRIASIGLLRASRKKALPKVTYTDPEVAQVGLSWKEAKQRFDEERLLRIEVPFSENDRAKTDNATDGMLIVIAKRLSGRIIGAHLIGPRAGELIAPFTLAIDNRLSLWKLRRSIFAYPTYSLIIKKAGDHFFAAQMNSLRADLRRLLVLNSPKLIAGFSWLVLVFAFYRYQSASGMDTTETALMIFEFVSMTTWGPLLYILFYTIRPITFFPATVLTILSGIFFGFLYGTILTIIAATLSAMVAFGVGRFFGTGLNLEHSSIGNFIGALRRNTFSTILFMRLTFMPFDIVSYVAGILRTRLLPFTLATFIGILLGSATFVSIGASLDIAELEMEGVSFSIFEPRYLLLAVLIFLVSLLVSRVLRRKNNTKRMSA